MLTKELTIHRNGVWVDGEYVREKVKITFAVVQPYEELQNQVSQIINEFELIGRGNFSIGDRKFNTWKKHHAPMKRHFPHEDLDYWIYEL